MTNPYITQLLAQAKIDAMRTAGAARAGGGGYVAVRRPRRPGRIRAWWDAQVHWVRRRPRRPATAAGPVATCSH
jgi:hypothetical protein